MSLREHAHTRTTMVVQDDCGIEPELHSQTTFKLKKSCAYLLSWTSQTHPTDALAPNIFTTRFILCIFFSFFQIFVPFLVFFWFLFLFLFLGCQAVSQHQPLKAAKGDEVCHGGWHISLQNKSFRRLCQSTSLARGNDMCDGVCHHTSIPNGAWRQASNYT